MDGETALIITEQLQQIIDEMREANRLKKLELICSGKCDADEVRSKEYFQ